MSHPAWDAWIEITKAEAEVLAEAASHPAWDAWIEIKTISRIRLHTNKSHPAWDAWIEISQSLPSAPSSGGRIPHGMRGLKSHDVDFLKLQFMVASRMGCVD